MQINYTFISEDTIVFSYTHDILFGRYVRLTHRESMKEEDSTSIIIRIYKSGADRNVVAIYDFYLVRSS